jgi:hypothetical protein
MLTIAIYAGLLVVGFLIGKAMRKYMYGEVGSDKIGDFARQPRRMKKAPQPTQAELDAYAAEVNIALTISGNLYKQDDLDFLHKFGLLEWAAPQPVNLTKSEAQIRVAKAKYFIKLNKLHMGIAPGDCDCAWTLGGIIDWYNPECEFHGHLAMRSRKTSKPAIEIDGEIVDDDDFRLGSVVWDKKVKAKPNPRLIRDVTA